MHKSFKTITHHSAHRQTGHSPTCPTVTLTLGQNMTTSCSLKFSPPITWQNLSFKMVATNTQLDSNFQKISQNFDETKNLSIIEWERVFNRSKARTLVYYAWNFGYTGSNGQYILPEQQLIKNLDTRS